ncbi:MAG: putative PurR-regulated permease PerM [Planctomycetota bacterium]|jgi:predicted PurR-regulated permease PerM
MLERLTPARRNFVLGLLGVIVTWSAWSVRSVLNPLLLGYLLAYIVHPMVLHLERGGWRRRSAVNVIFIAAGLIGMVVGTGLFLQGRDLTVKLAGSDLFLNAEVQVQESLVHLDSWLDSGGDKESEAGESDARKSGPDAKQGMGATAPGSDVDQSPSQDGDASASGLPPSTESPSESTAQVEPELGESTAGKGAAPAGELTQLQREATELTQGATPTEREGLAVFLSEFWARLTEEQSATAKTAKEAAVAGAGGMWRLLRALFGSLLAFGTLVVLLPVYTYFLLFELGTIHAFVRRYLPVRERARLARVGHELGEVLSSFFRGRLLVCLCKGLALSAGLWVCGVDYALLLGLTSGFLALIPFVGPMIGFLGAFLVGLLNIHLFGPLGLVLRLVFVFGIGELLEGYVLLPKIIGDTLGLHPVVVLASIMVGGAALGMFGFLLALPLMAGAILLVREFVLPALGAFADEIEQEEARGKSASGEEMDSGGSPDGVTDSAVADHRPGAAKQPGPVKEANEARSLADANAQAAELVAGQPVADALDSPSSEGKSSRAELQGEARDAAQAEQAPVESQKSEGVDMLQPLKPAPDVAPYADSKASATGASYTPDSSAFGAGLFGPEASESRTTDSDRSSGEKASTKKRSRRRGRGRGSKGRPSRRE